MECPKTPECEADRLKALEKLNLLDTPPEERFDRITRVAKSYFQVPIVLVSLVDSNRQWFKSHQGLDVSETPRKISFCGHTILNENILCIPNAIEDERFADNPLVTGPPNIRFYAGAPLHAADQQRIGTLCLIDIKPRTLTTEQLEILRDLANSIEEELKRTKFIESTKKLSQLGLVMEKIDNGVVITDKEGLVEWVNQGFENITGYSLDEIKGRKPGELLQGSDTDPVTLDQVRTGIMTGNTIQVEIINYHKNGTPYWVDMRIQPIYDDYGDLTNFIAIESDITTRKQAELNLRSSGKRIRSILDTVVDGIITIDQQGVVVTFNSAAESIFGYSADEVIGRNVNMLMPLAYSQHHKQYITNYLQTNAPQVIGIGREVEGLRKDGSAFPLDLAISEMEINNERMFTGIVRDITERKSMELASNKYEAIIENSDDAIISKTLDGIVTSWNKGAEQLFGYKEEEVLGKPMLNFYPPDLVGEEEKILEDISQGRRIEHFETQRCRKDGTLIDLSVTISPIIDNNGTVIGASKIARDITERMRLDKMKQEFISTVSHELRTPLTSICGALGIILGKFSDEISDTAMKMLHMADRNSKRLTWLINDILDLEKIELGQLAFHFVNLDLVQLIKRAVEDNDGFARQHQVRLEFKTKLVNAYVYGDEHRLLQVLANLISNAAKYSPKLDQVEISLKENNKSYRIEVNDHGPGIPNEFRERIFTRFAQVDSSDSREKGGTGLGLSISKAILERHNGGIGYVSEPEQGTKFYIDLTAIQMPKSQTPGENKLAQVLICEDNLDVANILTEILSGMDIKCDIAHSAKEASSALYSNDYSLMLLDLTLPDKGGLQFIRELRMNSKTDQLPIIVVSGRAREGRMSFQGDAVMVLDWIQKPVDTERLERALNFALKKTFRPQVLHVEDDPDIIQVVQALVEGVVDLGYVNSLKDARRKLREQKYDLVILDLGLADGSGVELIEELKGRCPVLIFSAQKPSQDVSNQVTAALTKTSTSNEQLLQTIKRVIGE